MAEDGKRIGARGGRVKGGAGTSQKVPFGIVNTTYAFSQLLSEVSKEGTRCDQDRTLKGK